jgi:hypothetical protein
MVKKFQRKPLGHREAHVIKRMRTVAGLSAATIADVVQRDKKSIYKVLSRKLGFAKRGAKNKLNPKDINRLVKILRDMIRKAKARWEITLAMLKKRAKCKVDDKVVRRALRTKNIQFRRLRKKTVLTKKDRKDRYAFGKKYRHKTRAWWLKKIQAHWDLKNWAVYTNGKSREVAAMRMVRGAYRAPGQGLDENYVVLPKDLRYNTGARSCRIAAAVGGGKVLLWHEVGPRWSGKKAADVYKGPLRSALLKRYPRSKSWLLLEDNDPTGFKSTAGIHAKRQAKIKVFEIPKRSPDLSVCDYALWTKVNSIMRKQERKFRKSKRETRQEYINRLRRVALSLPKSFIDNSIGDMGRRCNRLYAAKGGHFEEGGR